MKDYIICNQPNFEKPPRPSNMRGEMCIEPKYPASSNPTKDKLKIIKIGVEYHNQEDGYYTDSDNYYFYTFNKTEEEIQCILKELKVKQYDDEYSIYKNIDIKDLVKQLEGYEIYQIKSDVSCDYEINEESEYADYSE
jgi:hypothetical protein